MSQPQRADLLARLDLMTPDEIKRVLVHELTSKPLGLVWEADLIERDRALNSNVVLPELVPAHSKLSEDGTSSNLIIEGDNFDALRLLKTTHAGKIQVILIDPPYNTGNKDWVYNDSYLSKEDRWRHSTWLEFMYQRMVLARDLLAPNGVIMICINDENRARLELMMESVMPGRSLGSIVWRTRQGSNDTKRGNLSGDHEHVLVYANPDFAFKGFEKSYSMYSNPDNDPRGDWRSDNITCSKNYKERPNLYYPLIDPKTGIYYPPNPDSVWRYVSERTMRPGQRLQTKTMEEFARIGQILFPGENQVVKTWDTLDELLAAIEQGDVPKTRNKQLLQADLPNLSDYVGVPVGFSRPQFKRYKADLANINQPLSSWVVPSFEQDQYEAEESLVATTNHEGAKDIADIFGSRLFNYAKPRTLIRELLSQAARPGDTVLDFFAGSGTTGHAVLELNAEDGGDRSFILCSSTEATAAEPEKNLCLDVTAERIRRVIDGYAKTDGLEGDFAYLKLALVEEADLLFDGTGQHAHTLVSMRETGRVGVVDDSQAVWLVAAQGNAAIVLCPEFSPQAHTELEAMPYTRLIVYTDRPDSVMELFAETQKNVTAHSLDDVLAYGQTRKGAVPTQGDTLTEVEA